MKAKCNCTFCNTKMKLAWPGGGGTKDILACDQCFATCLRDTTRKNPRFYDWRPGRKTAQIMGVELTADDQRRMR